MLFMGLFAGISEDIANFFRDIMWDLISMQIWCIQNLINALTNGVLSFGILDNTWIKDGYTACIALMFIVLPVKIVYEFVFALIRDDDQNMDMSKKILGAIACVMFAVSLQVIVPLANNLSINVSKALIGQQYSGGDGSSVGNSNSMTNENTTKDLSKELVVSTLCAFGGMDRNNTTFSYVTDGNGNKMDIGAERFYDYIINPDNALKGFEGEPSEAQKRTSNSFFSKGIYNRWSFYYRWDTNGNGTDGSDDWDLLGDYEKSNDYTETNGKSPAYGTYSKPTSKSQADKAYNYIADHSGDYIWDFGYIGTIVGLSIFMIMLFIITIEVAMRIIMIGFLYIIAPLCSMSLTNYTNPQAFTVWKNSMVGMFVVNVTQIFLLQFLMNIASDISKAGSGNSNVIASIALYLGTFFAIISIPGYIQSMIGGYGQGIMESMQQLKGTLGATWGMTGGLAIAGGHKIIGRHNDNTGHLTGGLRGAIRGNKNQNGERVGGIANRARAIRGGIFGKSQSDKGFNSAKYSNDHNNLGGMINSFASQLTGRGNANNSQQETDIPNDFAGNSTHFNNGINNPNYSSNDINNANPISGKTSQMNFTDSHHNGSNANNSSTKNANVNRTRYGGLLGRQGIVDKTVSSIQNPKGAVKNAYRSMADVVGVRGSGPKNWQSFNKDGNEER